MKDKRKNHSAFFRGAVVAVAFALAVLCVPFNEMLALASLSQYTDFTYMTIGTVSDEVETTVTKGDVYYVPFAYIGGAETLKVGDTANKDLGSATIKSSSVTVNYGTSTIEVARGDEAEIAAGATVTAEEIYGTFRPQKAGTYTITYSYQYEVGGKTYTNSYSMKVKSELSNASINFVANDQNVIPEVVDLSLTGDDFKLYLPTPEVKNEDGEVVEDVVFVKTLSEATAGGEKVHVTVAGGAAGEMTLGKDERGYYITKADITGPNGGTGKYTVKYDYYTNGHFVTSTTKSTTIKESYYKDYEIQLQLNSPWKKTDGEVGVARPLPTAGAITKTNSTPAEEAVAVSYSVEVYYSAVDSTASYTKLDAAKYADVLNEDGTLKDPTEFKPLENGWYSFVYKVTDIYGKTASSTVGSYEWEDVKDSTAPKAIVYDASVELDADEKYTDEAYKLASRTLPNSVVVYAVGIEDNVESMEGVTLTRKIFDSSSTLKAEIKDFDQYNLIFNYRATDTTNFDDAHENLYTNNYLIRHAIDKDGAAHTNDAQMLAWLKEHNYRIVVDNNNYAHLYDIFADQISALDTVEKENALEWFKGEAAAEAGFAYINMDKTFGATTAEGGMGTGTYYIHYIAMDKAGNESTAKSQSMYVTTTEDMDMPTFTVATKLETSYLPTAIVKFDAPTPADNSSDNNMFVRTLYRALDKNGAIVAVTDAEGAAISTENLSQVSADWTLKSAKEDNVALTTKYADYLTNGAAGYVDLTNAESKSYSINLKDLGKDVRTIQVVSYAYDDFGNVNISAQTAAVLNAEDNAAPNFIGLEDEDFTQEYEAGAEIELPSFTVTDDAVAFVTYDVTLTHVATDGTKTDISETIYGDSSKAEVLKGEAGRYTVKPGKFIAYAAGEYQVAMSVTDANNNTIVSFVNYNVVSNGEDDYVRLQTSLTTKTANVGETVIFAEPTVKLSIADSVSYEEYQAAVEAGTEGDISARYIVHGVSENGKSENWTTNYGRTNIFTKAGTYNVVYSADVTVYDRTLGYGYEEWDISSNDGGYYTYNTAKVAIVDGVLTFDNGTIYTLEETEDGIKVFEDGVDVTEDVSDTAGFFEGVNLEALFGGFRVHSLESELYTITVSAVKPTLKSYNYRPAYSLEEIAEGGKEIDIYGVEGDNYKTATIKVAYKYADGTSGSDTYDENVEQNFTYKLAKKDATYTITYTLYGDDKNDPTVATYTIKVGDVEEPDLIFPEDFIKDSYELNGKPLEIDLNDMTIDDHGSNHATAPTITVKLVNTSTSKAVEFTELNKVYTFDEFTEVGSYTLTITVEDAAGNTATKDFTITVAEESKDATSVYKVVGTILIVVSVLVLVGVVVYFVVSKVKLDKELKK